MNKINNIDYELFTTIAQMKQKTLLNSMNIFLKRYYSKDDIYKTQDYILCKGNVPIMLVAHMDTVFTLPPSVIYHDQKQHVLWSPQGLGADDRAGVFAIMKIIQKGFLPHICLTTDEECGGIGAYRLIKKYPTAPFDIKYIVQLDRQGLCDCVFYNCANDDFQTYIEKFNYITEWGSFSDISVICPQWKIAGVNLSVGYMYEHTKTEILYTDALYSTINRVIEMIKDIDNVSYFPYVENPAFGYYLNKLNGTGWYYDYDDFDRPAIASDFYTCVKCKDKFPDTDIFVVKSKDFANTKNYYCIDCINLGVNWCEKCGMPFEADKPNSRLCPDCAGKTLKKPPVM